MSGGRATMAGMTHAPGRPTWADIGTSDVPAAVRFYTELFGWDYEDFGPDSGYGQFRKDGKQVAGIGAATDESRGTSWTLYLASPDVEQPARSVVEHGAQTIVAPMVIAGQGAMAVFADP